MSTTKLNYRIEQQGDEFVAIGLEGTMAGFFEGEFRHRSDWRGFERKKSLGWPLPLQVRETMSAKTTAVFEE